MLRGDMSAMSDWFKSNIEHGVMSPNDCRELLDMNPYEGGDIYLVPLNTATPKEVAEKWDVEKERTETEIENSKKQEARADRADRETVQDSATNNEGADDNGQRNDE